MLTAREPTNLVGHSDDSQLASLMTTANEWEGPKKQGNTHKVPPRRTKQVLAFLALMRPHCAAPLRDTQGDRRSRRQVGSNVHRATPCGVHVDDDRLRASIRQVHHDSRAQGSCCAALTTTAIHDCKTALTIAREKTRVKKFTLTSN
jgi:hypothetical protein